MNFLNAFQGAMKPGGCEIGESPNRKSSIANCPHPGFVPLWNKGTYSPLWKNWCESINKTDSVLCGVCFIVREILQPPKAEVVKTTCFQQHGFQAAV
jgi:hypothetical protein